MPKEACSARAGLGTGQEGMSLVTTWPLPAAGPELWAPHRTTEFVASSLCPEGAPRPPSAGPWQRRGLRGWEREVLASRLRGGRKCQGRGTAWLQENCSRTGPGQGIAPTLTFRGPETKAGGSWRRGRRRPPAVTIRAITNSVQRSCLLLIGSG